MLNAIDNELFHTPVLADPLDEETRFDLIIHGTITERYGHDILIKAMAEVVQQAPHIHLTIAGKGEWEDYLKDLAAKLELLDVVHFAGYLSVDDLLVSLRAADCGVIPLPVNAETDVIHTFKMQEYMALGIPVIASRTKAVEAYYSDNCVRFFDSPDVSALAEAILDLYHDKYKRHTLAYNALEMYHQYSAPKQRANFAKCVDQLLSRTVNGRYIVNTQEQ